jgi:hypothetical protein
MAYSSVPACSRNAFSLNDKIRARMEFALARLSDPAIPRQLAAFTFLRLTTRSMLALQRQGSDLMIAAESVPSYLPLAAELAGRDPEWWKRCFLLENGFLRCEDPLIASSLRPLNEFVGRLRRDSSHAAPLVTGIGLVR